MWCSGRGYPCVTIYFGIHVDVVVSVIRPTFSVPDGFSFQDHIFADSDRHCYLIPSGAQIVRLFFVFNHSSL